MIRGIIKIALLLTVVHTGSVGAVFSQSKEWEEAVIYSESRVPFYTLPDPLLDISGNRIDSPEQWKNERRPQLMGLFATTIYGRVPQPEQPIQTTYTVLSTDEHFFEGRCTRKQVLITFENDRGKVAMHLALFTPNNVEGPVPILLRMGFADAEGAPVELENIQAYGRLKNGTPLIDFLKKGFGVACIKGGEVIGEEVQFRRSIQQLFYRGKQSMPQADEWGVLAGISWQASRAVDYLLTESKVDPKQIALVGFSKLGKCALWAAAQDTRIAMVMSQNSGCAGAALWRRNFGETLSYMFRFPTWLCGNARKFIGKESDMPIDQHMLLACIAPRPVYVVSGIDDMWADNQGEYLSAHHATPVYELLGLKGQSTQERPAINQPADKRALAYHVRSGAHGYHQLDWDQYLAFMEFHFAQGNNK